MEFLKSSLWEVRKSMALSLLGGLLGLCFVFVYYQWAELGDLPLTYHQATTPMCWGFLEPCDWVRWLTPGALKAIYIALPICGGLAALFFFFSRSTGAGWVFLLSAWLLHWPLYVQDQRLSSNAHYLIMLMTFAFLFVPNKLNFSRCLLSAYFLSSGLQKLSPDWLSGQAFVDTLKMHVKLAEWLAAISVLAELLTPVALWFRDLRNFILSYAALLIYLGFEIYTFGYFDASILLVLTLIFPLAFYEERKIEREYLYQSFIRPEPSWAWVVDGLALFLGAQLLPFADRVGLRIPPTVSRTLALFPAASGIECRQLTFLVYDNRLEEITLETPTDRPSGYQCDPQLRFMDLRTACDQHRKDLGFKTIMSYMQTRKLGEADFTSRLAHTDFCKANLTYRDLLSEKGITL